MKTRITGEDINIDLKEAGEIGFLSNLLPAQRLIFREVLPTYDLIFIMLPGDIFKQDLKG